MKWVTQSRIESFSANRLPIAKVWNLRTTHRHVKPAYIVRMYGKISDRLDDQFSGTLSADMKIEIAGFIKVVNGKAILPHFLVGMAGKVLRLL